MQYDESLVQTVRDTLIIVLKIAGPMLLAGMVIGLLISLFQSVTSIQDQTLTFVPKIVGMVVVAVILLPWIVMRLAEFTADLLTLF
ncbi:MAG: flagellar biosynthetic protein FliQ [Phycisphaeraceae bacterium]|nr:MAG: flagellar biosynthetic protein FliQ [Phycisphaeraceae bacterium]